MARVMLLNMRKKKRLPYADNLHTYDLKVYSSYFFPV